MTRWRPKQFLPDRDQLPAVSSEYVSLEAMAFYHYDLARWRALTISDRAMLIAHVQHRDMRTAYNMEKSTEKKTGNGIDQKEAPWNRVFDTFFKSGKPRGN